MKRRLIILAVLLAVLLVEGFVLARMTRLNAERTAPRRVQFRVREQAETYSAAAARWRTNQPRHWRHVMLQR